MSLSSKRILVLFPLLLSSTEIFAGAFQLWEESAGSLGDYHAGGAAEADDASSIFYNPAGMSRIKNQQFSFGVALIDLGIQFNGSTYLYGTSTPLGTTTAPVPGDTFNIVPNIHYVYPIDNHWAVGFEETSPFGLSTDYHDTVHEDNRLNDFVDWAATQTELVTINFNPSVSYAFNDHFSVGMGVDVMYGQATYDNVAILAPLDNQLAGWGYGYNAGILWQPLPSTRLGMSYRSAVTINAEGDSQFNTGALANTSKVSASFPLPATSIVSLYHDFTQRFAMMASAFYTQWSSFHELVIHNMAQSKGVAPVTVGLIENYRDTWNYAVGAIYKINKVFSVESGFGHDQPPTQIPYRDIRLPDNNRYVGSIGLNVHPNNRFKWSFGWTHFFQGATTVDNSGSLDTTKTSSSIQTLFAYNKGTVHSDVNVYGLQFTIDF